ncbi:MAG: IS1634 family transposase [Desulfobacteraceae bacterium]|jgi:hypothetical protein
MYIRKKTRIKDGKSHAYWALVESYRTPKGPRQRTVAWLGELDEAGRLGIEKYTKKNTESQQELFKTSSEPEWVEVNVNGIRVENIKDFGGPWLCIEIIRRLNLDQFFKKYIPKGREHIPWSTMAQRGYSRDHRGDCKQVCLGLVVTRDGFPLGYEVFAGNRADVTTVEDIVDAMENKYGKANRIWVMDRGMTSSGNFEYLNKDGRKYILGANRGELKQYEAELLKKDWKTVHAGLEVKCVDSPDGEEVFILCRSSDRAKKEKAMHDRFEKRIEESLIKMSNGCKKRRYQVKVMERRVGRLLGKNSRAAGLFDIKVEQGENGGATVSWTKRDDWRDWSRLSEGCYMLRSNIRDWPPDELWKAYIQLTEAEDAFRIQKNDLRIRPIWHQKEERVYPTYWFVFWLMYYGRHWRVYAGKQV